MDLMHNRFNAAATAAARHLIGVPSAENAKTYLDALALRRVEGGRIITTPAVELNPISIHEELVLAAAIGEARMLLGESFGVSDYEAMITAHRKLRFVEELVRLSVELWEMPSSKPIRFRRTCTKWMMAMYDVMGGGWHPDGFNAHEAVVAFPSLSPALFTAEQAIHVNAAWDKYEGDKYMILSIMNAGDYEIAPDEQDQAQLNKDVERVCAEMATACLPDKWVIMHRRMAFEIGSGKLADHMDWLVIDGSGNIVGQEETPATAMMAASRW
jgi:hypothetical protein